MLHEFILANRAEILRRARTAIGERKAPRATAAETERGVPLFLTQLTQLLEGSTTQLVDPGARDALQASATEHGRTSWLAGISIGQVVHDYGDVCQAVTALAVERHEAISAADFRAFNAALDDATARAVTEYTRVRDRSLPAAGTERLGALAHKIRIVLSSAILSWDAIKRGVAGTGGSVGAMHGRSLDELHELIDRSFTEVRLDAASVRLERVALADFIEEEEIVAMIQARAHGLELFVAPVDANAFVDIDRQVLSGAFLHLIDNALKFTRPHTRIAVTARRVESRVYIAVEDECGGLPSGAEEALSRPLPPPGALGGGAARGLAFARRCVEANGGELRVINLPGRGCRFTIDLPCAAPDRGTA